MSANKLRALKKVKFIDITMCLWEEGPKSANKEYPSISVGEFETANEYYDTLRCPGCFCGSCVRLGDLADDLDVAPADLKPLAKLAKKLGEEEYEG